MRLICSLLAYLTFISTSIAQEVIPIEEKGGLHSAYVIPLEGRERVDVQLIILSGTYDEDDITGIAHYTEHLAALSSDTKVLQQPRQRDLNAFTSKVSTVYSNSGSASEIDRLMKLAKAVIDPIVLTQSLA